eukprot:m.55348 g.55348  ORF g.55348 m.55348 type:complete len:66 (+) comp13650_c1_seq92:560-757(+)
MVDASSGLEETDEKLFKVLVIGDCKSMLIQQSISLGATLCQRAIISDNCAVCSSCPLGLIFRSNR